VEGDEDVIVGIRRSGSNGRVEGREAAVGRVDTDVEAGNVVGADAEKEALSATAVGQVELSKTRGVEGGRVVSVVLEGEGGCHTKRRGEVDGVLLDGIDAGLSSPGGLDEVEEGTALVSGGAVVSDR